jgi:hypothetical protein
MNQTDARQGDDESDADPREPSAEGPHATPRPTTQAERSVMHPDADDPDWRYFFGAWHS